MANNKSSRLNKKLLYVFRRVITENYNVVVVVVDEHHDDDDDDDDNNDNDDVLRALGVEKIVFYVKAC